jgi:hypothetical protein
MTNRRKRPPKCPQCDGDHVVPIVYGLPGPELEQEAMRGEVVLGGCCLDAPNWACQDCEFRWEGPE